MSACELVKHLLGEPDLFGALRLEGGTIVESCGGGHAYPVYRVLMVCMHQKALLW